MKIQIAIVGAVIGFLASGFIGAVVGFLIGLYIEYVSDGNKESNQQETQSNRRPEPRYDTRDFGRSMLVLIAAIMNADGSAMKSELELVKRMLVRTYGEDKARQMLLVLRELLRTHQDVTFVCRQIRGSMLYSQRLELLHILFRISRADGEINPSELQMLQHIASQMGITTPDFLSLRAMFVSSPDSDFQILDVKPDASEEDVKKAYRKMAMRFHPDRLNGLSEAEKKAAAEKFVKVKRAYENIKRKKGWS
ncbi:MAG: TerB family tellurite resistance protein [Bacteroidetes bacterium]|nr:TerB family tellurite resistance protein [Bacteroidota bacterium]